MIELRPDQFAWRQIAEELRDRIANGTYGPGEKLPSEADLVGEFGVARVTIRKVMRHLREEGLIRTVPQIGSFVSTDPKASPGE